MILRNFILILLGCAILNSSSEKINEDKKLSRQKRYLLFPQYTVFQISMALVSRMSYEVDHRAVNLGFAISYGLPFSPKNFYNPIFWGRSSNNGSLFNSFLNRIIESKDEDNDDEIETTTDIASTLDDEDDEEPSRITKRDLSAGELYYGIRETLSFAGYHEECLLKSVCELAKHPLVEDKDNVMGELLHYVLTPSVHKGFDDESEHEERSTFEEAERLGRMGADCDLIYGSCEKSPLHAISNFIELEDEK